MLVEEENNQEQIEPTTPQDEIFSSTPEVPEEGIPGKTAPAIPSIAEPDEPTTIDTSSESSIVTGVQKNDLYTDANGNIIASDKIQKETIYETPEEEFYTDDEHTPPTVSDSKLKTVYEQSSGEKLDDNQFKQKKDKLLDDYIESILSNSL